MYVLTFSMNKSQEAGHSSEVANLDFHKNRVELPVEKYLGRGRGGRRRRWAEQDISQAGRRCEAAMDR